MSYRDDECVGAVVVYLDSTTNLPAAGVGLTPEFPPDVKDALLVTRRFLRVLESANFLRGDLRIMMESE